MQKIIIKTISDKNQRYNTIGDYYTNEDNERIICVSDMNNWKYEMLVAVHELIESTLCTDRGITDSAIDEFDFAFEEVRLKQHHKLEPGDDITAPYFKEHQFATKVEKMLAKELDVDWDDYITASRALDK